MSATIASPSPARLSIDKSPFDAFGYTLFPMVSRDDCPLSGDFLPPYSEAEKASPPPQYSTKDEPVTLAMYLFKFGFLFPPFWIMGIIILFTPLRAPKFVEAAGEWLPEKTDVEKQLVIERMRRAELRWARYCLFAMIGLLLVALVAGLVAWTVFRRH